jgi:hypothetical protein
LSAAKNFAVDFAIAENKFFTSLILNYSYYLNPAAGSHKTTTSIYPLKVTHSLSGDDNSFWHNGTD